MALLKAGLTRRELQAVALHCYDGFAVRAIADQQGCKFQVAAKRLTNALKKLVAAKIPVACVCRLQVKVIAVSKLGREVRRGQRDDALHELIGRGE